MGLGGVEGVTYNPILHGTTTLLAALDLASVEAITRCKPCHRHQECLAFLKPPETWRARRRGYRMRFTPTYASWCNRLERWFSA